MAELRGEVLGGSDAIDELLAELRTDPATYGEAGG
jgi:hypothetical protein